MTTSCAACGGTGYEIRARADGGTVAVHCECSRRDRAEQLLRAARIPRRYDHCTLGSFELHHPSLEHALRVATNWVETWPAVQNGLLFLGLPGTGKTHLAVGMARELARAKGARVLFHEQRELLKALQSTFDAGSSRRESEILGPVCDVEILILDDLGAGRTTAWARDVMHDVISHRYNEKLPVIMTSNRPTGEHQEGRGTELSPEGLSLQDRLGDALMSRLYEMCLAVPFEGNDYRRGVLHARHRHF